MERLKVNYVSPWNIDCGVCAYAMFLERELRKKNIALNVLPIDRLLRKNPFYFISLALRARKNADLVNVQHEPMAFGKLWHMANIFTPLFYSILAFPKRPRIITTIHEPTTEPRQRGIEGIIARAYIRFVDWFIISFSDIIIILSRHGEGVMRKKGARNIVVIPHGSYVEPKPLNREEAKKNFLLNGRKVITIFGFINRRKNYLQIARVLKHLPKNVSLLIAGGIGDEAYYESIVAYLAENALSKRVVFSGLAKEKDFPPIFSASDVVLFPYTDIMQSGALSVALAYKKPCICSDIPGFREVKEEFNCIELAASDSEWMEKIKSLLRNKNRLNKGIAEYRKKTNYRAIAQRVFEQYAIVASKGGQLAEA